MVVTAPIVVISGPHAHKLFTYQELPNYQFPAYFDNITCNYDFLIFQTWQPKSRTPCPNHYSGNQTLKMAKNSKTGKSRTPHFFFLNLLLTEQLSNQTEPSGDWSNGVFNKSVTYLSSKPITYYECYCKIFQVIFFSCRRN